MPIPSILPMERMLLTANYLRMKSHVVEYRSILPYPTGKDTGYYVDLTDQPVFNEPDRNSCLDLQFADIEDMIYGRLDQKYARDIHGQSRIIVIYLPTDRIQSNRVVQ